MKKRLLLGAHMSIAGGFHQAIHAGQSIHCTTIQIFTKSNRQWASKKITDAEIEKFQHSLKASSIEQIVAHSSYLINIGSPNKETEQKSVQALADELQRCQSLQIPYLVVHPGSHLEGPIEHCLETIARNINIILNEHRGSTMILIELMAGQGTTVGNTFEQLASIRDQINDKNRIGICFDTCHAWSSGYDFSNSKKYDSMWQKFDDTIGIQNLKVIHMNDSKALCGSHVDRHESIGKGHIGIKAFGYIMNDERFFDIPKILETPKTSLADDLLNMNVLKATLTPSTRKTLIEE